LVEILAEKGKLITNEDLLKKMIASIGFCWQRVSKIQHPPLQAKLLERFFRCLIELGTFVDGISFAFFLFRFRIFVFFFSK
jgi:hypothetical protein